MKKLLTLLVGIILLTTCADDSDFDNPTGIFIRVENASGVDFKDIFISSGSRGVEFGDLKAGKKSDFNEFENAYRYGFVRLMADGEELRLQPFDYVGETPLSNGYYTYKLNLDETDPENVRLSLEFFIVN
ncbi:hypothetical protein [Algoriphagus yeomjeoni]|uniref:DUF4377 domain-containing protein n=1 Tax=Algoriphagus yeomjeoni TaxID=291403 RepID=A0A327NYK1_9BACT|nr:hypothetical protein [Algoriphagus yeomjeoni]RAI83854.1 hypothetical protein LV83_04168 [Algoriphagus yeomjeoni]